MHHTRRLLASLFLLLLVLVPGLALAQANPPRLLMDMTTGEVLFEEDAGQPWHPASLTKLMTALLAFEAIDTGQLSLSSPVVISANALSAAPSRTNLPVDTAITLEDALYILIVQSANDIAIAIGETVAGSEAAFVAMMNQRAAQLGLTGTHYVNPHGLHDPRQVTTARDLAIIALNIRVRFPQYDPLFSTHAVAYGERQVEANNELLSGFFGTDGMKTGYVCASGLNIVATARRNGRWLMAVVLGGASGRDRGEMAAQLLLSGFGGGYRGTGQTVLDIANHPEIQPVDMRSMICGADAPSFTEAREAAFPAGLAGQVTYLADSLSGTTHRIVTLGRQRDVPFPRQRPDWLPAAVADIIVPSDITPMGDASMPTDLGPSVPLPLPRPAWL